MRHRRAWPARILAATGSTVVACLSCALHGTAAHAEPAVLVEAGERVPSRVFAELLARGVAVERVAGDLPASAEPGTKALRSRRGGRVLEVWVASSGDGGWDLRAQIPFDRDPSDEGAVRAAEAVRAATSGSGDRALALAPPAPSAPPSPAPAPPNVAAAPSAVVPARRPAAPADDRAAAPSPAPPRAPGGAGASTTTFAPPHQPSPFMVAPRRAARTPPSPHAAPTERDLPVFEVGGGAGLVVGSTGAAPVLDVTARAWWADALGIGVYARPALTTTSVDDEVGSADLHGVHVGGSFLLSPTWLPDRALVLAPEVGVGFVRSEGRASSPYRGLDESDAGLSLAMRVELRHALHPAFAIGVGLVGGAVLPPVAIRFAGEERARWDAPFGAAILSGAYRGP